MSDRRVGGVQKTAVQGVRERSERIWDKYASPNLKGTMSTPFIVKTHAICPECHKQKGTEHAPECVVGALIAGLVCMCVVRSAQRTMTDQMLAGLGLLKVVEESGRGQ